mmetsp:Transcript_9194/g.22163  ORF Transcript_9194/g.22163 Transcript_9194/m.22163 type:complete len:95 (-) Transcript_9194:104-388(-)
MPEEQSSAGASSFSKYLEDVAVWVKENRLKTVGGIWATGIVGSLAYQWSKDIPTSMKIIHSRVYAQAITLGALSATAVMEMYSRTIEERKKSLD